MTPQIYWAIWWKHINRIIVAAWTWSLLWNTNQWIAFKNKILNNKLVSPCSMEGKWNEMEKNGTFISFIVSSKITASYSNQRQQESNFVTKAATIVAGALEYVIWDDLFVFFFGRYCGCCCCCVCLFSSITRNKEDVDRQVGWECCFPYSLGSQTYDICLRSTSLVCVLTAHECVHNLGLSAHIHRRRSTAGIAGTDGIHKWRR